MKINLLRTLSTTLCFGAFVLGAKAQSASQIQYFEPTSFPRSPTSTGLEKYGSYQVNEFTGIPDISIPLYTIEAGGFTIPITLSYHASGVKITDVASWVGSGWSVSAGGSITRRIMGLADDCNIGYMTGLMKQPGTIDHNTVAGVNYLESVSKGLYDTKPDIYSYDFSGHSGKFFLDGSAGNNYVPRLIPYAPINIKYTYVTPSPTPPYGGITRFSLADEHGNNYTFGDSSVERTYSSSGGAPATTPSTSSWMLENMISQNKRDTVSFSYHSDSVNYQIANTEIYTVIDQIFISGTCPYTPSYSTGPTTPGNLSVVDEKLPAQINFKNGRVVFDMDDSLRKDVNIGDPGPFGYHAYGLKDIKVYNYNYGTHAMELQKTIVFYKSYFNLLLGAPRLKLDSIQVLDKTGSMIQHYTFDYNNSINPYTNLPMANPMPGYTGTAAFMQDYWGYYNGKPNDMLTPQQSIPYTATTTGGTVNVTIGSSVLNGRDCDSNYMQACVLTGIHYPTGGHTTFTYQTNQYLTGGVLKMAGGLRVKTITSYDGINPVPMVKTYVYNNYIARPNFLLDFCYFSTEQTHRWIAIFFGGGPALMGSETVRTFMSTPHADLEPYDAATVVYPAVTEYTGTPGNNAGRTDYTFTDAIDATEDASMAGTLIYNSAFYLRGHLFTKNEYIHKPDGSYQLVKALTNSYTAFPYTNYDYVGLAVRKINYNEGPEGVNPITSGVQGADDFNSYLFPYYFIVSDDNYITGTITKEYDTIDTSKFTTSTSIYKYDNIAHQQVNRTYHTDSKGNTTVAVSKYPADYPAGNAIIDSMLTRNMQAEVIEKYDTLKNVATSVNAITSAQLNQFKAGSITGTIVPSKISTLSVAQPLANFTPASVVSGSLTSDSRYAQMISFDNYDASNNIGQYTTRNATPTSIIWDYQHYQPIAQVKNATNANIAYTSFEADGTGNWTVASTTRDNTTAALTGVQAYNLSSGAISKGGLTAATTYVVTYWTKNASPLTITGTITGYPLKGATLNGWTFYEHHITGQTTITVSGSGNIDELRLYPLGALMTSYTYAPFMGVTSTSDAKGEISYYEYDSFNRLMNIKDQNGNIIKNYSYHYPNQ
jgi:hypothetical protein